MHFLDYCSNLRYKSVSISIVTFICQAAVKKSMLTCPVLNLFQSIFSCLSALKNLHVNLSWAKFSSSLIDIKICHKDWPLWPWRQRSRYIKSQTLWLNYSTVASHINCTVASCLINVVCLYQVMIKLYFLNDVAIDAESTQTSKITS